MGRKSNQECLAPEPLASEDRRTAEKRTIVIEKLRKLGETDQNINDIINSLECYCAIILQSLEIK